MGLVRFVLIALCAIAIQTLPAYAQHAGSTAAPHPASALMPEYIQEFFLGQAVRSQGRGETQITTVWAASPDHNSSLDGSSADVFVQYGITDRLQCAVELPYGFHATPASDTPQRLSTLGLGLLREFVQRPRFEFSSGATVSIPLTDRGETAVDLQFTVAHPIGPFQFHANLEPTFASSANTLAYDLAVVRSMRHQFYPTFEFNARHNADARGFYLTPGLYRHLPHRVEIGIATPIGISRPSNRVAGLLFITWEFGGKD